MRWRTTCLMPSWMGIWAFTFNNVFACTFAICPSEKASQPCSLHVISGTTIQTWMQCWLGDPTRSLVSSSQCGRTTYQRPSWRMQQDHVMALRWPLKWKMLRTHDNLWVNKWLNLCACEVTTVGTCKHINKVSIRSNSRMLSTRWSAQALQQIIVKQSITICVETRPPMHLWSFKASLVSWLAQPWQSGGGLEACDERLLQIAEQALFLFCTTITPKIKEPFWIEFQLVIVCSAISKVIHLRDQIEIGLRASEQLMEKRCLMVCANDKSHAVGTLKRRVMADASTKFEADIQKLHHIGFIDLSKFGRLTVPIIDEVARWSKRVLQMNEDYSNLHWFWVLSQCSTCCTVAIAEAITFIFSHFVAPLKGTVLVICPMLPGNGILGGLRGEYRRVEDKFVSLGCELKTVQIMLDVRGLHGNRTGWVFYNVFQWTCSTTIVWVLQHCLQMYASQPASMDGCIGFDFGMQVWYALQSSKGSWSWCEGHEHVHQELFLATVHLHPITSTSCKQLNHISILMFLFLLLLILSQ